ncbi:MAG: PLP-dependent aminotransferase family protein [Clostridia bacterium]|nr:PLP-dependent aminotransferase family protein [Clostridia bacterium]
MKYVIDKNSKTPIYVQLYEQIKNDIVNGVYGYNTKLPSKRFMSEELQISVITVEHTYVMLCDEGYADSRQRSGYFVTYSPDESFSVPSSRRKSLMPHGHITSLDDTFPFSVYAKTMRKILSIYSEDIFTKCEGSGCIELKTAICRYLSRSRGISVREEQLVIGAGAEYLYGIIVQMLGKKRIYAVENPSYEKIEQVYGANGVEIELLPLGENGIKSEALSKTKASVLHITPYRSFPSGVTATASKKNEYIRWKNKSENRIIVEDDFESEFTLRATAEETVFSLSKGEGVIYVNTFSKTISPAVRIAYMILPENMIEAYKKTVGFYSCTVPYFNQLVLAQFIENGDFERSVNRARRKLRKSVEK